MEIMNWIKENQGKTVLIVVVLVALVYLGLHHKKEHQTLSKDEKMKKREQEKLKNEENLDRISEAVDATVDKCKVIFR